MKINFYIFLYLAREFHTTFFYKQLELGDVTPSWSPVVWGADFKSVVD